MRVLGFGIFATQLRFKIGFKAISRTTEPQRLYG